MFAAWKEHERVARELGLDVAGFAETRAIKSAIGALVADRAHSVLEPEQKRQLTGYLEEKRAVEIGGKHRMLRWFARHSMTCAGLVRLRQFCLAQRQGQGKQAQGMTFSRRPGRNAGVAVRWLLWQGEMPVSAGEKHAALPCRKGLFKTTQMQGFDFQIFFQSQNLRSLRGPVPIP